ncbi:hypothetical protein PAMP_021806 [Pampus punctatissimus]
MAAAYPSMHRWKSSGLQSITGRRTTDGQTRSDPQVSSAHLTRDVGSALL